MQIKIARCTGHHHERINGT